MLQPSPCRSSLALRRGPSKQRKMSLKSPASSQHKAAPTQSYGCH
ncbi:hypothetical protein PSN_4646 [Pseudomonas sp. NGC7]